MTPITAHHLAIMSNLYNLMAPAIVGVVIVFAVVARLVANIARRSRGRQ